jgi:hypothetical protein
MSEEPKEYVVSREVKEHLPEHSTVAMTTDELTTQYIQSAVPFLEALLSINDVDCMNIRNERIKVLITKISE